MTRVLVRSGLSVLTGFLVIMYVRPLADGVRAARGLGLENLIFLCAASLMLLVPLLELVRFAVLRRTRCIVSEPRVGVIPAMATRPQAGMTIERRARHEAAHAVAALALGQVNLSADVHVRGSVGGTVHHEHPPKVRLTDGLFIGMTIAVAGFVADLDDGVHDEGSSSDIAMAQRHALSILSASDRQDDSAERLTSDHLIRKATATARSILERERRALDEIADALVEHTHLDDADLRAFGVSPRSVFDGREDRDA